MTNTPDALTTSLILLFDGRTPDEIGAAFHAALSAKDNTKLWNSLRAIDAQRKAHCLVEWDVDYIL